MITMYEFKYKESLVDYIHEKYPHIPKTVLQKNSKKELIDFCEGVDL